MASMGPRSFNRGNAFPPLLGGGVLPGFNGAAVFQPRKRFPGAKVHKVNRRLQWGRGLSTAETSESPGGNAGPPALQWGRGLSTAETTYVPLFITTSPRLQWGRGLSTAETSPASLAWAFAGGASMGPRSFNRGNPLSFFPPLPCYMKLQWGRGLSTAETGPDSPSVCRARSCFNGAAVFQPRKRPPPPPPPRCPNCFNGAAVFQPRKPGDPGRYPGIWARFNGAAVFQPRKRPETGTVG